MARSAPLIAFCSLIALSSGCASMPAPVTDEPDTATIDSVSWDRATDFVGTSQRVCGPLAAIGNSDDDVFLNIGYDYPDPARFTIVVWDVGSVYSILPGTTVCATGTITMYEGVPEIELRSADLVETP